MGTFTDGKRSTNAERNGKTLDGILKKKPGKFPVWIPEKKRERIPGESEKEFLLKVLNTNPREIPERISSKILKGITGEISDEVLGEIPGAKFLKEFLETYSNWYIGEMPGGVPGAYLKSFIGKFLRKYSRELLRKLLEEPLDKLLEKNLTNSQRSACVNFRKEFHRKGLVEILWKFWRDYWGNFRKNFW